jgi:ABC transport system ATP-binding/permease protein
MLTTSDPHVASPVGDRPVRLAGMRVEAIAVDRHAAGRQILHQVTLAVEPGELVAIAGPSGAGKSTLLDTLAGLTPPSTGVVLHDGEAADAAASDTGYVPQDDIIHRELPLRQTLRYAAGLRLSRGSTRRQIDAAVDDVLDALDLTDRGDVRVGDLSGGQRKRASIAAELLTHPRLLLLDEPTSGLDPATAAEVLGVLQRLTHRGVTVVLTTHAPADLDQCDRVVFLTRDGHLAFAGTPDEARRHFAVGDLSGVYRRLGTEASRSAADQASVSIPATPPRVAGARPRHHHRRVGAVTQWALLARRSAEVMVHNRLTVAVLLGSPLLVTTMMAVLFRPGAFEPGAELAVGPAQTVFWLAFAGFFFGLTYGLLQIVGEMPVVRRERLAGLRVGSYVLAKVAVLTPVLAGVTTVMLTVLRLLDRLPARGWSTYLTLGGVVLLTAIASLALGLLASAAVADPAQATLALPMLCFPQVLFAGGVVPVGEMSTVGQVISAGMANRWAYEGLGRTLDLSAQLGEMPAMAASFDGSSVLGVVVLGVGAVVCGAGTSVVLHLRTRV